MAASLCPYVHCYLQNVHVKAPLCVTPSEVSLFYTPLSTRYLSTLQGTILDCSPSVCKLLAAAARLHLPSISMDPEAGL